MPGERQKPPQGKGIKYQSTRKKQPSIKDQKTKKRLRNNEGRQDPGEKGDWWRSTASPPSLDGPEPSVWPHACEGYRFYHKLLQHQGPEALEQKPYTRSRGPEAVDQEC
ncbi:unnamed protein product [Arctogadus glacialis]